MQLSKKHSFTRERKKVFHSSLLRDEEEKYKTKTETKTFMVHDMLRKRNAMCRKKESTWKLDYRFRLNRFYAVNSYVLKWN